MKDPLVFGTDGWRGLIARDFTFANLRRMADALARALPRAARVAVGYDRRFLSEEFARQAAGVLSARGHRPCLGAAATTSPALSFSLKGLRAAAGVMITASHNPPAYNGFKIKVPPGRSADPAWTARVEALLGPAGEVPPAGPAPASFDPGPAYVRHLLSRLHGPLWRNRRGRRPLEVVVDAMHGTGGPVWERLLEELPVRGTVIRGGRDPLFGGCPPEPIEPHLAPLIEAVRRRGAALGLAVDGDGDRLGVVDDTGAYLPPHTVFPLLLGHLVETRKLKGAVVQAASLGYLSERMAEEFGLPFLEVPVGFKHVAEVMLKRRVLLGGEESGGYGVGFWGPERDGILSGLLLMESALASGASLSALRARMAERFGASVFKRLDVALKSPIPDPSAWSESLAAKVPDAVAGRPVRERRRLDGLKVILKEGGWVLLRPSGTEPLLRLYAEAPTPGLAQELLAKAQEWAGVRGARG